MDDKTIAGVRFEALDKYSVSGRIRGYLEVRGGARVFTPNTLILAKASNDEELRALLGQADLLLPDGVGISLISLIRGYGKQARITGIDTAEWVLRYAAQKRLSVYLLGGGDGVAHRAAERLRADIPELIIAGTHHGYLDGRKSEYEAVIDEIRHTGADVVFVCMGFPKQERWICANASSLPSVRLFMGLGGSLDVWCGSVRRAPLPFRALGIEWLWRTLIEPHRAKELLAVPTFLIKTLYGELS